MHKVASCFVGRSNSVRKTRPFAIMGDDSPDPTAVFQRTFWLGPNSTGGLPSPIPEEFGPLNCGHSAAPAKLDRATVARRVIQEARVMMNSDWDFAQVYKLDGWTSGSVWWGDVLWPSGGDVGYCCRAPSGSEPS